MLLLQLGLTLNLVLSAVVEFVSVSLLLLGVLHTFLGLLRVEGVLLLLVGDIGVTLDVEPVLITGLTEGDLVGVQELGVRGPGGVVLHEAVDTEVLQVGLLLLVLEVDVPLVGQLVHAPGSGDCVGVSLLLSSDQLGADESIDGIADLSIKLPETVIQPNVGPGGLSEVLGLDSLPLDSVVDLFGLL